MAPLLYQFHYTTIKANCFWILSDFTEIVFQFLFTWPNVLPCCSIVILLFCALLLLLLLLSLILVLLAFFSVYVCVLVHVLCLFLVSYGSPLRLLITFWNYQIYIWDCPILLFYPFSGKRWSLGFGLRFLS